MTRVVDLRSQVHPAVVFAHCLVSMSLVSTMSGCSTKVPTYLASRMSGHSMAANFAIVNLAIAHRLAIAAMLAVDVVVLPRAMDQEPYLAAGPDRLQHPHQMVRPAAAADSFPPGGVQLLMSYPIAVADAVSHKLLQDLD